MSHISSSKDTQSFTFSALCNILSDSFAICRTKEFPGCGSYYYSEIKSAKWENRPIHVLKSSLHILDGKIENLTRLEKKKIIIQALSDFTFRNIPDSDAKMYCKDMRWVIV